MPLFQNSVLAKYKKTIDKQLLSNAYTLFKNYFHNATIQENIRNSKEEQFQEGFLNELFVKILGYTLNPNPNYNLITENKNIKDSKKADGAILVNNLVKAVIELKGTDTTDLGKIETQAFGYKNNQPECVYVITSNFEKLRFYIDNAIEYLEFNLFTLTQAEFELLYTCLAYDNIKEGLPKKLKDDSIGEENKVTKQLYTDYSLFKKELYQSLVDLNSQYEPLELFKKSQKLLDRFLFLFFAEDRNLLPPNSVRLILNDWKDLQERDEEIPLYNRFKKYFEYLNTGFKGKRYDVFAYNGGLFKPDEILDNVKINDDLLFKHAFKLSEYDFESEIDVNILGHIFENSLNELDEIKAQLEGQEVDKTKTKRKKDGVFYTPKYITKYIVDNTVGKLCTEKKTELQVIEADYTTDKKRNATTKKALLTKLNEYRNWLLQLTICDPACGSGAFLNQALDFLITEHKYIDELQAKLFGDAMVLSDVEKSILENNLFGVDLNEESVEIAKLSLWLRTAQPNRKLNDLNNNIKCGNSLIDDPNIAGDKAFNWQTAFPQVFEKGGFDVIIGNPPYVFASSNIYYEKNFKTYDCKDLYAYFYEKSIKLLKRNGALSLITPSSFLSNIGFESLRIFLIKYRLNYIIDLGANVFSDASVDSAILVLDNIEVENNVIQCSTANFKFYNLNKSVFNEFENTIFNIYINQGALELCNKIDKKFLKFDAYVKFSRGVEFGFNSDKVIDAQIDDSFKPILCGGNIMRNRIQFDGKYFQWIHSDVSIYKPKEIYEVEKILVRRIGSSIISSYDSTGYYNVCDVYNLQINNESNYRLKSISGIINSKLIGFYFDTKFKSDRKSTRLNSSH
jgi:hypothetical protein